MLDTWITIQASSIKHQVTTMNILHTETLTLAYDAMTVTSASRGTTAISTQANSS